MKNSRKAKKPSTKKKPARRAKRTAPHVLTPGERQVLLKPPGGYDDVKAHARVDPALAEAFAFLTEALRYAPRDGGGGEEPPA